MKILLIPSAALMPREMRCSFGDLPTALFPLGDRPMLWHIYQKYKHVVDEIFVITYQKSERIDSYIHAQKLPIKTIRLQELRDLGYTVAVGLQEILQQLGEVRVTELYVNFADSLIDELPLPAVDTVYYSQQAIDSAWTYFTAESGSIRTLFDKQNFMAGQKPAKGMNKIFVGVFGFSHPAEFYANLQATISAGDEQANGPVADSFYRALKVYSQRHMMKILETDHWFDVGHNENYVRAQTRVAARSFNVIRIDERRGMLTKTSSNKAKLVDEIQWYLRMPGKLQYLLPRIYDYSLDVDTPYVTMEYYGYHTLHESLLYGDLSLQRWQEIFEQLKFVLQDMESFRISGRKSECQAAMREMCVQKTVDRLEKIRHKPEFALFFRQPICINGRTYMSLDEILSKLSGVVETLLVRDTDKKFCVIHGDLCFTNILIEDSLNFMRFIDPRGKFGSFDIYGDVRYEMAKLLHTMEGHYDYIIEDMFEIKVNGTDMTYIVHSSSSHILKKFLTVFQDMLIDTRAVKLIEATLFLSMIPLHSDYLSRQYAMLATGVQLFWQVLHEESGING